MKYKPYSGCFAVAALALLVGACAAGGDVRKPIPTEFFAAKQTATRLVVMLPGRGDNLPSLKRKGLASIIQKAWPDADVILTGLTMPFYRQGRAPTRLHDEVIAPTLKVGPRKIWLMGISLGGMGALLYEHDYPGQVDGMLLMSPYLGDDAVQNLIRRAGGLQNWNPGPSRPLGPDTFQHELWRTLKNISEDPERSQVFWLAYGADEPFRTSIELMSPMLPAENVVMLPGQHNWSLWTTATGVLLERVSRVRRQD